MGDTSVRAVVCAIILASGCAKSGGGEPANPAQSGGGPTGDPAPTQPAPRRDAAFHVEALGATGSWYGNCRIDRRGRVACDNFLYDPVNGRTELPDHDFHQAIPGWPVWMETRPVLSPGGTLLLNGGFNRGDSLLWRVYSLEGGAPRELPGQPADSLPSEASYFVQGVNDAGHAVGWRQQGGFFWDGSAFQDAPAGCAPLALNNDDVLGGITPRGNACLAKEGTVRDLGSVGHELAITALTDGGLGVGTTLSGLGFHGFFWDGSSLTDLCPAADACVAYALNEAGDVVGRIWNGPAVLWRGGKVVDLGASLDDPSVQLVEATGINDAGAIVAAGIKDGSWQALLLTPR